MIIQTLTEIEATDGQDMNFVDNNAQLGLFTPKPY